MRLPKLILVIAALATFLPGCAQFGMSLGGDDDDPVIDASVPDAPAVYTPTADDCARWHREAIERCKRLFQAGTCYEDALAEYQTCLSSTGGTPTATSTPHP